jgi:hypothetical protein
MNRVFAQSPDYSFRRIAARKKHPCAHIVATENGLVTVTFVHHIIEGCCSRCNGIMPLTFWQFQEKPAVEMQPS